MMINMFEQMVMGHLVGDFIVQPKWMAMGKADKGWRGALTCTLHVLMYTLCIAVFTGLWDAQILLAIAVPHWIIDRHSLAALHLGTIGGRTPKNVDTNDPFDPAFTAIMYTVVDLTMHLLFLWGVLKLV